MPEKHIPLIMSIMDNIVSPDSRRRKYSDRQILKILILLQIFNIYPIDHQEYSSETTVNTWN